MNEQWINQIRQKMEGYKRPAPEVSWDELEKALAANRPKARTVTLWRRRIAAAAAVLLTAGAGYWVATLDEETDSPVQETLSQAVAPLETATQPEVPPETVVETDPPQQQLAQAVAPKRTVAQPETPQQPEEQTTVVEETEAQPGTPQETVAPTETAQQTAEQTEMSQKKQMVATPDDWTFHSLPVSRPSRLTAKAYLSNTMASSSNSNAYYTQQTVYSTKDGRRILYWGNISYYTLSNNQANKSSCDYYPEDLDKSEGGVYGVAGGYSEMKLLNAKDVVMKEMACHHQPIRLGLSLRYALNDRWNIESGLTYTRLSADFTRSSEDIRFESEQTLQYIGVPLNISYQLWGSRHFSVYATGGGMAEKMVKGKRTTRSPYQSKLFPTETTDVSIRPLQLSVNGALGTAYNLNSRFSIYAEPGLAYYFDNGSSVPTFYQDKPLSFNLSIGLRMNLK